MKEIDFNVRIQWCLAVSFMLQVFDLSAALGCAVAIGIYWIFMEIPDVYDQFEDVTNSLMTFAVCILLPGFSHVLVNETFVHETSGYLLAGSAYLMSENLKSRMETSLRLKKQQHLLLVLIAIFCLISGFIAYEYFARGLWNEDRVRAAGVSILASMLQCYYIFQAAKRT